jgi:hypothetical protein
MFSEIGHDRPPDRHWRVADQPDRDERHPAPAHHDGDPSALRIAFVVSPSSYVVLTTDLAGCGFVGGPVGTREGGTASDTTFRSDLATLAGG